MSFLTLNMSYGYQNGKTLIFFLRQENHLLTWSNFENDENLRQLKIKTLFFHNNRGDFGFASFLAFSKRFLNKAKPYLASLSTDGRNATQHSGKRRSSSREHQKDDYDEGETGPVCESSCTLWGKLRNLVHSALDDV